MVIHPDLNEKKTLGKTFRIHSRTTAYGVNDSCVRLLNNYCALISFTTGYRITNMAKHLCAFCIFALNQAGQNTH